jgi:hypothetical protein
MPPFFLPAKADHRSSEPGHTKKAAQYFSAAKQNPKTKLFGYFLHAIVYFNKKRILFLPRRYIDSAY